jgi:hypothetical protein
VRVRVRVKVRVKVRPVRFWFTHSSERGFMKRVVRGRGKVLSRTMLRLIKFRVMLRLIILRMRVKEKVREEGGGRNIFHLSNCILRSCSSFCPFIWNDSFFDTSKFSDLSAEILKEAMPHVDAVSFWQSVLHSFLSAMLALVLTVLLFSPVCSYLV